MVRKIERSSRSYQVTAYFNDDDLADTFEAFAEDFKSESAALVYCLRQQLQREVANGGR